MEGTKEKKCERTRKVDSKLRDEVSRLGGYTYNKDIKSLDWKTIVQK